MLKLPENAISAFSLNGYLVVEDAFDPEPVRTTLEVRLKLHRMAGGGLVSGGYRPDVLYETLVQDLYTDPDLIGFASQIIGDDPAFGSLGSNVVPGNSPGMDAHIDYPYFAMAKLPANGQPALCVQMIWYPEDVTEDFAPTAVVPGSHLQPSRPGQDRFALERFRDESVPILAKAGSLFIGHGALWHAVMPNKTDRNRPAILGSYVPYWVRPMLRADAPQDLPPVLRQLMCSNFGERIGKDYSHSSLKI